MVVFSNNNYDFLLRDGLPHKCLGKANRPTVFTDKDRIPSNAKKVLIYTEGLNGVGSCRKSSLAESRSWDVTSTFQHPNVSDQVQERHRSLLGIDWKGQLALLAFAPTSVSAWLTARSMSDVGWWFHQILPSVSVCVCVVLYRCVCLLSFGINIFFLVLPPANRWRAADGRTFHFKWPVGRGFLGGGFALNLDDGLQRLFLYKSVWFPY